MSTIKELIYDRCGNFKVTKDNIGELFSPQYNLKKPTRDKLIEAVNQLEEVQEYIGQMDSDTIEYTGSVYLDALDTRVTLIREIKELTKDVKW